MASIFKKFFKPIIFGLLTLLSIFLLNQIIIFIETCYKIHQLFGHFVLVSISILLIYFVIVPIIYLLKLPKVILRPENEHAADYRHYLLQVNNNLQNNPILADQDIDYSVPEKGIAIANTFLNAEANKIIKQMASYVCVSTAISQYGKLDTLIVLFYQVKMVWQVAHLYNSRPHWRELLNLYGNVAATSFIAGGIEDIDINSQIEPLLTASLGHTISSIPVAGGISNIFIKSIISGSTNAFLTIRTGMIAKRLCSSLTAQDKLSVRRSATLEAGLMLGSIVVEASTKVGRAIAKGMVNAGKDFVVSGVKFTAGAVIEGTGAIVDTVSSGAKISSSAIKNGTDATIAVVSSGVSKTTETLVSGYNYTVNIVSDSAEAVADSVSIGSKRTSNAIKTGAVATVDAASLGVSKTTGTVMHGVKKTTGTVVDGACKTCDAIVTGASKTSKVFHDGINLYKNRIVTATQDGEETVKSGNYFKKVIRNILHKKG